MTAVAAKTMRAVVVRTAGGPEVLHVEELPIPEATPGKVLIRVRAFGINRSEMFTRQGLSPDVTFPRVLGIEAVGVVAGAPGGEFREGDTVATIMGGMGRDFDGGYAEYTLVPARNVRAVATTLPWERLGALPEMLQTAWGSLHRALRLQPEERLLIRGGTTSVGLAAAAIAKKQGASVVSTTRRPDRETMLREAGADDVVIDSGAIAPEVARRWPGGIDKVLELIGTTTLVDSLHCAKGGGAVCLTGMVGNAWTMHDFEPMAAIPTAVNLTTYDGGVDDFVGMPFQELVDHVASGGMKVQVGKVFSLDDIVEAHRLMDSNKAGGKIVVLT